MLVERGGRWYSNMGETGCWKSSRQATDIYEELGEVSRRSECMHSDNCDNWKNPQTKSLA